MSKPKGKTNIDVEKGLPVEEAPPKNEIVQVKKEDVVVMDSGGDGASRSTIHAEKGPLTSLQVTDRRQKYGLNTIASEKKNPCYMTLLQAFLHPFNILLVIIAILSAIADEYSTTGIISVMVLISTLLRFYQEWTSEGAVHGLLKLITKSVSVIRRCDPLDPMPMEMTVPAEELVPGDWVVLRPGELVPADAVVVTSKVFYVSQAPLTGEALPVEKYKLEDNPQETEEEKAYRRSSDAEKERRVSHHKRMSKTRRFFRTIFGMKISTESQLDQSGFELKESLSSPNHVFMGTQVITGMATVRIIRTGPRTLFGRMAESLSKNRPVNPFQQGVRRISWIFFLMLGLMVPPVCVIQAIFGHKNDEDPSEGWRKAFIFSLSVAVGLTPEMLPMIVNGNLAKGSIEMSKKRCIIKKLDAIINLGAVDVLCTDKTGTLTRSVVHLNTHLDPYGSSNLIPLQIGYLNSYFQSILQNPLDTAITTFCDQLSHKPSKDNVAEGRDVLEKGGHLLSNPEEFVHRFSRVDEIPFDFVRRRLSVVLKENKEGKDSVYLVCKGAVEEILGVCTKSMKEGVKNLENNNVFPSDSDAVPLNANLVAKFLLEHTLFTERGERVLAVAYKTMPVTTSSATAEDESHLIFVGFLSFTDPPKESSRSAIADLIKHNVEVKVLTGDSANICATVCSEIELPIKKIVTGDELAESEKKGYEDLSNLVKKGTIFAKLTPLQKLLVVKTLKSNNHVVAFMGDGINDAPALREADVGISVENGVDICREAANVIFLDKDLSVVVHGVRIGRRTYGNTIKYIAMTVSSNFGNVFSVLVATCWLPYEPMSSLHLLTQNLLYDCSQLTIPWDTVDDDFITHPHKWKTGSILRFMVWMGPWSSIFDISTFLFMYYHYQIKTAEDKKLVTFFQTAWFTVGLLTQTLIVHMIRTTKIPIFQSRAALPLTCATLLVMAIGLALPYIPDLNEYLKFKDAIPLPWEFYAFLGCVLLAYCLAANIAKFIYIKIFKEWF